MSNTTRTVVILGLLTLGGYLVYKSMKPKGTSTPTPPPPPPTECLKCTTIRCSTGTHAEELGECGCQCVADEVSHPAPPSGCHYDKDWNLICESDEIGGGEDVVILPPPIFTGGGGEVFDGGSDTPIDFDYKHLLAVIQSVYLSNDFPFDEIISAEIFDDLKSMGTNDLNYTYQFFADSYDGKETSQDVEDSMDLIFAKYPSLGKPFVVKSAELQDAINQMSTSRKAPDGESSPTFLGLSEETTKEIMAVGDILAGAAAILLTGGVGVAVAACWGLAKKVFGLFRKKNK